MSGDFPKETHTECKSCLEKTILALEEGRANLVARLEVGTLTDALDAAATLTAEHDEKVVRAQAVVGDSVDTLRPAESLL